MAALGARYSRPISLPVVCGDPHHARSYRQCSGIGLVPAACAHAIKRPSLALWRRPDLRAGRDCRSPERHAGTELDFSGPDHRPHRLVIMAARPAGQPLRSVRHFGVEHFIGGRPVTADRRSVSGRHRFADGCLSELYARLRRRTATPTERLADVADDSAGCAACSRAVAVAAAGGASPGAGNGIDSGPDDWPGCLPLARRRPAAPALAWHCWGRS